MAKARLKDDCPMSVCNPGGPRRSSLTSSPALVSDGDLDVGNVLKADFALHLIVHSPCTRSHTSHHSSLSTASAGRRFLTHFYPRFTDEDTTDSENQEIYLTSQRGQAGARIQTQVHLGPELSWFRTEESLSRAWLPLHPASPPPPPTPPTYPSLSHASLCLG